MLKNLTKILLPIFATSLFVEFYEGEKDKEHFENWLEKTKVI